MNALWPSRLQGILGDGVIQDPLRQRGGLRWRRHLRPSRKRTAGSVRRETGGLRRVRSGRQGENGYKRRAGRGGGGEAGGAAERESKAAVRKATEEWGKSAERKQGWIAVGTALDGAGREDTGLQGTSRFMTSCGCRTRRSGSRMGPRRRRISRLTRWPDTSWDLRIAYLANALHIDHVPKTSSAQNQHIFRT